MSCPCDTRDHPKTLDIPPGLAGLPRAIGRFDDFRAAMWAARADHVPLRDWSGQAPGDLGAMLVDFWAVVCDIAALYDEARANEAYIGTAPAQIHLNRLIGLLGYRPKPATAASAWIAMEMSGAKSQTLPGGSAFRSGPVGDGPPQVFETAADVAIHPALGALGLDPPAPATLAAAQGLTAGTASLPALWVQPGSLATRIGGVIVIEAGGGLYATRLSSSRDETFGDGSKLTELTFYPAPAIDPGALTPDGVKLWTPGQTARLWSATDVASDPDALTASSLVLSSVTGQIASGAIISLEGSDGSLDAASVATAREVQMTLVPSGSGSATSADDDVYAIITAAVTGPSTQLTLSSSVTVGGDSEDVVVGYSMIAAATLATPPVDEASVGADAALPVANAWRYRRRWPDGEKRSVTALIADLAGNGAASDAELDPVAGTLTLGGEAEAMELTQPITAYANAVQVTRGETVPTETLGVGDGGVANQSFKLQKPLTYLSVPTEAGYAPALTVRVDGIAATEATTLYAQAPEALVYTLHEDEDGATHVTFGDGRNGARLSTGAVVTAEYRTGAGANRPGPDSITQMVTPAANVTRVHQPFAAWGGSDREDEDLLRINAPRSALLIGRAISLADFEAAALTQDGVSAAQATWAWSKTRQRPVAQIWFAGDAALAPELSVRLRALSDPSTPIEVAPAAPDPVRLALQVAFEAGYKASDVLIALREALTVPRSARFCHALPRIGAHFFRSALAAEALAVAGVRSLDGVTWKDGAEPDPEGEACAPGAWFTTDPALDGALILNGEEGAA